MKNSQIKINNLLIKNRLVMPPMATAKADDFGAVTKELIDFYEEKTAGGYIGLVIMEHAYISMEGKANPIQVSISKDKDIEGLKKIVEVIHNNGSKVFAQINHAGGAAKSDITGMEIISSSAVKNPKLNEEALLPREMTKVDIKRVIEDFVNGARRAKIAGFDGVEIHSAHGYLLNQFYSPLINKRSDEYTGKTLEGRISLHIEIIKAVKSEVGEDYPVAIRLGGCDYMEGGSTVEDCVFACVEFEKAGVDLLDISGGFCGYNNPFNKEEGYFKELTQGVKEKVKIPVILTGGVENKESLETLLKEERADLIGVGRAILKNSMWAKDAMDT